jgi:hypothetical protein
LLHWSHCIVTGVAVITNIDDEKRSIGIGAFTGKIGIVVAKTDEDDVIDVGIVVMGRRSSSAALDRTARVKIDCIFSQNMNPQQPLSVVQKLQYGRYARQLYRMLLRVSDNPKALPTAEARAYLRSHTRQQFRYHAPMVRNQGDAQALLERAYAVLLAVVSEAEKRGKQ